MLRPANTKQLALPYLREKLIGLVTILTLFRKSTFLMNLTLFSFIPHGCRSEKVKAWKNLGQI
jgi:hypothetical protein|tara:strand:+ start:268 stop:456 length:189 start_codon:yes stop_codon:yes gene_type:complete